jgi:hypothetical protein
MPRGGNSSVGFVSWVRDVIADRGEHDPIPIHLERVGEDGYAFRLGVRAGFGGQQTARIPVDRRTNPAQHPVLKEIHSCEVAGQVLEAANVYSLKAKVARALETIAPGRALPVCEFRVPEMDYALPVYEDGGMLTSPVLGGPKLKAPDLAGIRRVVCRYLESAGYVQDMEGVTVGVVRPRDLRRVPPAAVFRSQTDPELWLPSVEGTSPDGPVVGIVGHAPQLRRRERRRAAGPTVEDTAPAAPDVVALLRYLCAELGRAGEVAVALEDRGINVFLAPDEEALATQLGSFLASAEFLRFAEEIQVERVEQPRPERLGVESITNEPEEVHAAWS